MPAFKNHNTTAGVPGTPGPRAVNKLTSDTPIFQRPYAVSGITKDSTGAILPNCVVTLYRTADNTFATQITSDANGAYSFPASSELTHYAVAYKVGAPDVAGTTVNTLVGL